MAGEVKGDVVGSGCLWKGLLDPRSRGCLK